MALIGERSRDGIGRNYAMAGGAMTPPAGGVNTGMAGGAMQMPGMDLDYEIAGLAVKAKRLEGQPLTDAQRDRVKEVMQALIGLAGEDADDEADVEGDEQKAPAEGEKKAEGEGGGEKSEKGGEKDKPAFLKGK